MPTSFLLSFQKLCRNPHRHHAHETVWVPAGGHFDFLPLQRLPHHPALLRAGHMDSLHQYAQHHGGISEFNVPTHTHTHTHTHTTPPWASGWGCVKGLSVTYRLDYNEFLSFLWEGNGWLSVQRVIPKFGVCMCTWLIALWGIIAWFI